MLHHSFKSTNGGTGYDEDGNRIRQIETFLAGEDKVSFFIVKGVSSKDRRFMRVRLEFEEKAENIPFDSCHDVINYFEARGYPHVALSITKGY